MNYVQTILTPVQTCKRTLPVDAGYANVPRDYSCRMIKEKSQNLFLKVVVSK